MAEEMPLPYETPTTPEAPQGQTGVPGVAPQDGRQPQPSVNLDEFPQFREWKSKMDSQLAREATRAQQAEVRLQALEADLNRWKMDSMDEPTRIVYERDEANKRAYLAQTELARVKYFEQVKADNEEIAARLSIPVRELETQFGPDDDPHVRWTKAYDYAQRRNAFRQTQGLPTQQIPAFPQQPPPGYQQPQQPWQQQGTAGQYPPPPPFYNAAQNPANHVDTGAGASGSLDRYNAAYREAYANNDSGAMLQIEELAGMAGVPIQRIK